MENDTIVVMVSIGDRSQITSYTFPRLAYWATKHGYSSILLKNAFNPLGRAPHFNKLQVHKILPNFTRYIIIDDDLLMSENAPEMEEVPEGFIGLCMDAEQRNTKATHVKWTANTGFIVADKNSLTLLDEAYELGQYPFGWDDENDKGIWGPHDQGILNDVVFRHQKVYKLNQKWNYQPILDYFINDKDWQEWQGNKWYRMRYYLSLVLPFPNKNKSKLKQAYGNHLIRAPYYSFFCKVFK